MKPIPITQITAPCSKEHYNINAHQLKGAFTDYAIKNLKKKFKKKKIPLDIMYNRDKDNKQIQRYPLLQFGVKDRKIHITGIQKGAKLLETAIKTILKEDNFTVNNKTFPVKYIEHNVQYWYPQILPYYKIYKLENWNPFDKETLKDEKQLQGILYGNIMRIIDDLKIKLDKRPDIKLINYRQTEPAKGSKINWLSYNASFSANINLPQHIGIGHEPRLGFGKIFIMNIV